MKKILYISFLNEDIRSGYKQKIHGEYEALLEIGLYGELIIVGNSGVNKYVGDNLEPYTIRFSKKRKKIERNLYDEAILFKQWLEIVQYEIENFNPDYIYIRRIVPITPRLIELIKYIKMKNIKIIYEYPTLPWENEIVKNPNKSIKSLLFFLMDKIFFNKLERNVDLIPYMGNYEGENKKYIHLTNCGTDRFYKLKKNYNCNDSIRFIGVAHVSYWHGYDILIDAIKKYYNAGGKRKVYFDIVGNVDPLLGLEKKVHDNNLEKYIIFHGLKEGKELDDLFDNANIGVNALRHAEQSVAKKYGITTLKTVEYTFRGLKQVSTAAFALSNERIDIPPFLYVTSTDIDIKHIIKFYDNCKMKEYDIREYAKENLSWNIEMKRIVDLLEGEI